MISERKESIDIIKKSLEVIIKAPEDVPTGAFASVDMLNDSTFAAALLYLIELSEAKKP